MIDARTIQRCIDQGMVAREMRLFHLDIPSNNVQNGVTALPVVCAPNVDLTRDAGMLNEVRDREIQLNITGCLQDLPLLASESLTRALFCVF